MTSKGGGGGPAAAVVVVLLVLAGAVGGYVWHDRRTKEQQQQQAARDAMLGGGEVLAMIENPLRRGIGDGAAVAETEAPDYLEPVAMRTGVAGAAAPPAAATGAGTRDSTIYAPPAWIQPAQESPTYYSDVAAAPGTVAEYAAPNERSGNYGGGGGGGGGGGSGGGAAAYASLIEGGSALYMGAGSGTAAAYAPITNVSGVYAPSGGVGDASDGALYTNDAYGNVAGSTV